nr:hypothetical protein [Tanacetum cinerariifolium]
VVFVARAHYQLRALAGGGKLRHFLKQRLLFFILNNTVANLAHRGQDFGVVFLRCQVLQGQLRRQLNIHTQAVGIQPSFLNQLGRGARNVGAVENTVIGKQNLQQAHAAAIFRVAVANAHAFGVAKALLLVFALAPAAAARYVVLGSRVLATLASTIQANFFRNGSARELLWLGDIPVAASGYVKYSGYLAGACGSAAFAFSLPIPSKLVARAERSAAGAGAGVQPAPGLRPRPAADLGLRGHVPSTVSQLCVREGLLFQ